MTAITPNYNSVHSLAEDAAYVAGGLARGDAVPTEVLAKAKPFIKPLKGLASAPIGFIIGYNTDLLFSLLERICNALFPKVPDSPVLAVVPQARPEGTPATTTRPLNESPVAATTDVP